MNRPSSTGGTGALLVNVLVAALLLGDPGRAGATLCCNAPAGTCAIQTGGTCPSGSVAIAGTSCTPYPCTAAWATGAWGTCSATCGGGTQTRTVQCVIASTPVALTQCSSIPGGQPATQQACNTQPCFDPQWLAGAWSTCSATCGGGIQQRSVQCVDAANGNTPINTSNCIGPSPATQQACNTQPCPQWLAGAWSTCSASCGGGTQTRSVACVDPGNGNAILPDASCANAGARPPSQQTCNTQACSNPQWLTGSWSTCSATCGGGMQTRTVSCVDAASGNTILPDTACSGAGPRPASQQTCNPQACTGACCTGSICVVLPAAACTTIAGRYNGDLVACNPPGNFTVPCCAADHDDLGTLNVSDIFDFLSAWFAANPNADIDGIGGLQVNDIFTFLGAWFAGC